MSSDFRSFDDCIPFHKFRIDDLLAASRRGAVEPPVSGRRARRRAAKRNLAKAGLVAPLLAAEGCLSLGKKDVPLDQGGGSPGDASGGDFTAVDDHYHVEAGRTAEIPKADLLTNDIHDNKDSLEIVRVFDAVNGTAMFDGAIVQFAPDEGFQGSAGFSYEVRDASGALRVAEVVINVGDAGQRHHDEDGQAPPPHDDGPPHPDDPAKASEHMALLNLVPIAEATHVAVNNGSWFDPSTWANGEVPGDGARVHIPEGVSVAYDGESDVSLFTVRVDGSLEFATDRDTFMEVDTLIVASSGHMSIGTIDNPVAANVSAVIQIADNGPIDVAWDPQLLSRGVISHGTIDIHGAEKEAFLKVAADPMKGDTSMTLEAPPEGWQVGDRLVLTGTHVVDSAHSNPGSSQQVDHTEDEELLITRIEGNVVHFDRPLAYDHDSPRADLKAYVANYSRNVQFVTENSEGLPVHQRGHVMLMHSDNIDVRYAEFYELGRTDKSERAFDVADLDAVEPDSNVKARYPLHIHRAGVSDLDDPAMLVGNAVWGAPGWGFVHHDSNAVLADNAAYDVFGAAFVAETGNEIGRWVHNIAIKSIGVTGIGSLNNPKGADDVHAFDLGRTGAGFWFQGRLVDAVDNVAAGVPGGQAFVYFHRGALDDLIKVTAESAPFPEAFRYADDALVNVPSISQFTGNEAIASNIGFMVVKAGPVQRHDIRSVIDDFTAWDVKTGVHFEYTGHYTITDLDVVGAPGAVRGIDFSTNAFDLVVNGARISGFEYGVSANRNFTMKETFDGDFQYVFVDVDIDGAVRDYNNIDAALGDRLLTGADLSAGPLSFQSDHTQIPTMTRQDNGGNPIVVLSGVKTDSLGPVQISTSWDEHFYYWNALMNAVEQEGFWTLPDGRLATVVDQYIADRATGELIKVGTFVAFEDLNRPNFKEHLEGLGRQHHGVLDPDSAAPLANPDNLIVGRNGSLTFDPLANDFDPDGDPLALDGLVLAEHGEVHQNDDGAITYTPDPNYAGPDQFYYWVEDDNGNFAKGVVNVSVEI